MHAEATTFSGLKLGGHPGRLPARARTVEGGARRDRDLRHLRGRSAPMPPSIRVSKTYVAAKLNLTPEPVSTQVIPRDRHAMFFATLGVVAASVENLATEIRFIFSGAKCAKPREYFAARAKRLVVDAPQAQPGPVRKISAAGAAGPFRRRPRLGGCDAVARTRHLAFVD